MSSETQGAASTIWGSNASGGDITIDSLYELRDTLNRVAGIVNLPPENDGGIRAISTGGEAALFALDNDGNLLTNSSGIPLPSQGHRALHGHWHYIYDSSEFESPQAIGNDPIVWDHLYRNLFELSQNDNIYENTIVLGLDLNQASISSLHGPSTSSVKKANDGWDVGTSTIEEYEGQDIRMPSRIHFGRI